MKKVNCEIAEAIKQLESVIPLTSLIDEMVTEAALADYSLRTPAPISQLMQNEEYIRGVLGINIPLNESYPYSPELQERILEEQLLFEGFFEDAKELGGNLKKIALALRYIFEDGSRIKSFISEIYSVVIKNPMEKLLGIIKKVIDTVVAKGKELGAKGWDIIDDYLGSFADRLETVWEKVQSADGWKGAMAAVGLGAAVYYIWDNSEDIWDEVQDMIDKLVDFGSDKANEGALVVPALGQLILSEHDDNLNEFLGKIFGKKNKGAEDMGLEVPAGSSAPADGILISPEQAKEAGIEGKSEDEAEEEKAGGSEDGDEEDSEEKTMVEKIIAFIKEKIFDKFMDAIKGLAFDALLGAVSGGVGAMIKQLGKLYGGAQFVAKILGGAAEPFISKIENPEEEMEEMEKGEDDPTEATWHDNEKLIREYVREKLLAS